MQSNEATVQANKAAVVRFNRDVIERGDAAAFRELVGAEFVNRTAPPGTPAGPEGMLYFFDQVLRPALSDLAVDLHDVIAEGDKVTTRKTIRGTHTGVLFGAAPTNKRVAIEVIDVVRLANGRYVEHWGLNTLEGVVAELFKG